MEKERRLLFGRLTLPLALSIGVVFVVMGVIYHAPYPIGFGAVTLSLSLLTLLSYKMEPPLKP
ncbi:MAG: hypothetical protein NTV92_07375 [Candidatus Bipolaricaulota bacterium]|nr:hypothetical protein [Candidatus Bipolaricaulota bacterium]